MAQAETDAGKPEQSVEFEIERNQERGRTSTEAKIDDAYCGDFRRPSRRSRSFPFPVPARCCREDLFCVEKRGEGRKCERMGGARRLEGPACLAVEGR